MLYFLENDSTILIDLDRYVHKFVVDEECKFIGLSFVFASIFINLFD